LKQALLISGLPAASKKISTGKDTFASMPLPRTYMLNNLTSPEARGSFGTVAQEEAINKTTPLNKTVINIDLIEITSLLLCPFLFPLLPYPLLPPSPKTPLNFINNQLGCQ
jgi:hypothetical protein